MARAIVITIIITLAVSSSFAQKMSLHTADSLTYDSYVKGQWKEVIKDGKTAIKNDIDFYYLRMRMGIASYIRGNYINASAHFEKALEQKNNESIADSYLYNSYLFLNRGLAANNVYASFPDSKNITLPGWKIYGEAGFMMSELNDKAKGLDLDQEDNIYGEITSFNKLGFYHLSLAGPLNKSCELGVSYVITSLNKTQRIQAGDSLIFQNEYPLLQHQLYFSSLIYLEHNWYIKPVFNYTAVKTKPVFASYTDSTNQYSFQQKSYSLDDFVAGLEISKESLLFYPALWLAYSDIANNSQFQSALKLSVLPFGNLKMRLSSSFVYQWNKKKDNNFILKPEISYSFTPYFWAFASANIGSYSISHDEYAFIIYNNLHRINFKSIVSFYFKLSSHLELNFIYKYRENEMDYTYYESEDMSIQKKEKTINYKTNYIGGGLLWKL